MPRVMGWRRVMQLGVRTEVGMKQERHTMSSRCSISSCGTPSQSFAYGGTSPSTYIAFRFTTAIKSTGMPWFVSVSWQLKFSWSMLRGIISNFSQQAS
jgi:hypothetical protein